MSRYDTIIYGPEETHPRARHFQFIARSLRGHIQDQERMNLRESSRIQALERELQQELANVGYLDIVNQEQSERVAEITEGYVQVAMQRDANADIARTRSVYVWVLLVVVFFLLLLVIILALT